MASVNKVTLMGHLGVDPQVNYSKDGIAIANLSLATTKNWVDQQTGERKSRVEWHKVVLYRRIAEVAGEYLHKGSLVYIEGELRTRKWAGDDGTDRYTTEVVGNVMQMVGGKAQGDSDHGGVKQHTRSAPRSAPIKQASAVPNTLDMEDDIPF